MLLYVNAVKEIFNSLDTGEEQRNMTHQSLYQMLEFPAEVVEQLNSYEKERTFRLSEDLQNRLLSRIEWDDAVNELQGFLGEDTHGFKMLYEMLDLVCNYSYPKYREMNISDDVFVATMKFITRFLEWHKEYHGEYKFTQGFWFPRQMALTEFRTGALEYEFVDGETREIAVHIPSDAKFDREAVLCSLKEFTAFQKEYFSEWKDVPYTCDTWMLAPAMEELLGETSNVLAFKHMFELDVIDEEATWFMGFVFPGHEGELDTLPEKTSLQKKIKESLLAGKKIGVAKGHIKEEILQEIGA